MGLQIPLPKYLSRLGTGKIRLTLAVLTMFTLPLFVCLLCLANITLTQKTRCNLYVH